MGFTNSDGSDLIGGLNPSCIGQALEVDASGRLITQDFIRQAVIAGQDFIVNNTSPSLNANTYALSVFNPANSGKSILIYSVRMANGGGPSIQQLTTGTSDPAYGNSATPINTKIGGAASAIATHVTYATTNQSVSGTVLIIEPGPQNTPVEMLSAPVLLPAGSAKGLIAFMTTFSNGYLAQSMRWIEF